ncbi:type IV conjugative transfer system protein TraL [Thiorhodovibrio frisius]|uniref:Type IV conjugative transfer system protein TraL n=1 Tax=Thiorhodovibrio frisius TaxID=631362 RepID=H8YVE2_9GAMM|nr:type IV conjugative transfer system protein TraL [Thiorhodovibrio frisius]EIC23882.1 type IV conjugative transfer system protein TraL [Thiorhodovibrio frisius]WPL23126.1 type IV conjugative transfer system protein TraL [Thiorhodovibrio frisius]
MHPLALPHGVDDPPSLLLWRLDELIPLVLMLVIGMLSDRLLIFLALGLGLSRLYGRFRDSRPDGFTLHWGYWHGLVPLKARRCPNPFTRRFQP